VNSKHVEKEKGRSLTPTVADQEKLGRLVDIIFPGTRRTGTGENENIEKVKQLLTTEEK